MSKRATRVPLAFHAYMSLFGGAAPSTPAGGGLFGSTTSGAGSTATPFGAPPAPTPGLFGAAPAPAPAAGGLFGAATPAAGGLFGAAPAPAPAGGLFGAAPAPAPAAAGGLFGSMTPAAPATGGGLFGSMTPAAPTTGGGLFGSTTPAAPSTGGGLFGGGGGLFGAAPAPALGGGTGLLGAPQQPQQQQPMQQAPSLENGLGDGEIFEQWQRQMVKAWDDKDYKLCSFKYVMFDDLSQAGPDGLMQPPTPDALQRARAESLAASDTGMWERADAHNPNPARFVPRQITGFNALHERRIQQIQAARDIASKLRESETMLRRLEDERQLAVELRLRHYAERHQILSHRVLRLHAIIERQHLLRCHSGVEPPLNHAEQQWIGRLNELATEMERPDAGLMRLYDVSERLFRDPALQTSSVVTTGGLPSADTLHLDNLEEWLGRQQQAVTRLIEVSQQDLKDAHVAIAEAQGARAAHAAWGA